jgi:glycosyltransferase involved in cell wall biosynthesis
MTAATTAEPPLISIILLCFNHARYIDEALDGVFAQTYLPLDIIIVDDCSSDRTADIIEARLARRRERSDIRFVRNECNMGHPIPAILGMARGSFIVIACGDDIMLPHMLERMAATWLDEKVSLVTANVTYIDENSNLLNRTARHPAAPADDSFETLARDGVNACCFGAAMGFERAICDTFGWPPTDFLGCSDIVLPFYAHLLNGARFINEPLLKYRVHSHNSSLSLAAEKATGEQLLLVQERICGTHLKHAILFDEELDRLRSESPARYADIADRIRPLAKVQIVERARKLVRTWRELHQLRKQKTGEN